MVRANPNYEFEAKIIRDVITGTCNEQSHFTKDQEREDYAYFIYDIKDGKLSESEVLERYRHFYSQWNDPDGIKQNIGTDSPYYYDNGENNTFDTQILKMAWIPVKISDYETFDFIFIFSEHKCFRFFSNGKARFYRKLFREVLFSM